MKQHHQFEDKHINILEEADHKVFDSDLYVIARHKEKFHIPDTQPVTRQWCYRKEEMYDDEPCRYSRWRN